MKKYVFGIDIGGTSVKVGLFNTYGDLVDKWEVKTDVSKHGENILKDIFTSISQREISLDEVLGYGFGVPGPVIGTTVVRCVNLGWENYDLKKHFQEFVDSGFIYVENDANVATLGETWKGAGKAYDHSAMITLGTGVGGGVVSNNRIVEGAFGSAGEFGHIRVVHEDGYLCNCGNHGCLETIASATGIKRVYSEIYEKTTGNPVPERPSAKRIMNEARDGDAISMEAFEKVCYYLGYACSIIAVTTNPAVIIFGGGVSRSGQFLLDNVDKYFRTMLFSPVAETKLVTATLGNDAGMYGAASLVINNG